MTPPVLRYVPRVTVEVRSGLSPYEHVELRNVEGAAVATIQGLPVGDAVELEQIVDHDVEALRAGGFDPVVLDRSDGFGGRPASWIAVRGDAGVTVRVYCVDGGWVYIATAGTREQTPDAEAEVFATLASIELRGLPRPASTDVTPATWRRERAARPDWSRLRAGWIDRPLDENRTRLEATGFTAEELAAVAALGGADSFPGVRPDLFDGWSSDARAAAIGTATRSLVARGVLVVDMDGALVPSDEWREAFAIAVDPDLIVAASRHGRAGARGTSFACSDHRVVAIAASGPDLVAVSSFEPERLADEVLAVTGFAEHPGDSTTLAIGDAGVMSAVFDEQWTPPGPDAATFAAQAAEDAALVRVVSIHRDGDAVVGGELRWVATPSGLWEYTNDADGLPLLRSVGSEELLAALRSYLPGATEAERPTAASAASASLK